MIVQEPLSSQLQFQHPSDQCEDDRLRWPTVCGIAPTNPSVVSLFICGRFTWSRGVNIFHFTQGMGSINKRSGNTNGYCRVASQFINDAQINTLSLQHRKYCKLKNVYIKIKIKETDFRGKFSKCFVRNIHQNKLHAPDIKTFPSYSNNVLDRHAREMQTFILRFANSGMNI